MVDFTNKEEFFNDMDRWAEELEVGVGDLIGLTALKALEVFVKRSPVDTGRFRAAWNLAENAPDPSVPPEGKKKYPAPQIPRSFDLGRAPLVYVTNALPYAATIEYGGYKNPGKKQRVKSGKKFKLKERTTSDGYSLQAPKGVVRIGIQEVEAWFENQVRDL